MTNIISNIFFDLNENEVSVSGISYLREKVHIYAKTYNDTSYSKVISKIEFNEFLLNELTVLKIVNKMEYTKDLLLKILK